MLGKNPFSRWKQKEIVPLTLTFSKCSHIWEAIQHVWPDAHWPGKAQMNIFESRL